MNNTFDFSYFVPTPDTTANCALSRWNDGLMGLSDFLKAYMSSRQSLEFGFSRNLNIKELLNLSKETVEDEDGKKDYVINYRKFGDVKAHVCGFEIPIVDFTHPFIGINWLYDIDRDVFFDSTSRDGYVTHVFNYNNSILSTDEKISATLSGLEALRYDVENVMTSEQIATYFNKNIDGSPKTKLSVLQMIDDAKDKIDSITSEPAKSFLFGRKNKNELEMINILYGTTIDGENISFQDMNVSLCRDMLYWCLYSNDNFKLDIDVTKIDYINERYFYPNGIELIFYDQKSNLIKYNGLNKCHLLLFFRFNLTENPTIVPFFSHDGTQIPLTRQQVSFKFSMLPSKNETVGNVFHSAQYWDYTEECPLYYDKDGNPQPMTLESNINGMGGRDYTFWSSPVQKTESGYQFECCMPLAFYNAESDSYSNEYYATNSHEGIEIGEVMYRVPVVKRMRQNIEEAIVNTHLTKCLGDLVPATNENAEDDDTVVLGGVVVDDFTEGLYPVAETQRIATETDYGEVKIVKVKDSDGDDNGVLDLMYHYSETGELSYDGMTMPETGRAVDMITLFDTLKDLGGGQPLKQQYFVVNGYNDHLVNVNVADSSFDGESSLIINPFNIMLKNTWNDSNTGKECKEDITFMGDGQIYIHSESITDNKESVIHTEPSKVYMKVQEKENDSTITKSNIELSNSESNNYGIKLSSSKKIILESDSDEVNIEGKYLYFSDKKNGFIYGGSQDSTSRWMQLTVNNGNNIGFKSGLNCYYNGDNDSYGVYLGTIQSNSSEISGLFIYSKGVTKESRFNTNVYPEDASEYNLGRDEYRWKTLYADNIVCNTIKPEYIRGYKVGSTEKVKIPVGTILFVYLSITKMSSSSSESAYKIYPGDRFDIKSPDVGSSYGEYGFYDYHNSSENETPSRDQSSSISASLSTCSIEDTSDGFKFDYLGPAQYYLSGKFVALMGSSSPASTQSSTNYYIHHFNLILLVMKEADVEE